MKTKENFCDGAFHQKEKRAMRDYGKSMILCTPTLTDTNTSDGTQKKKSEREREREQKTLEEKSIQFSLSMHSQLS